MYLCNISIKVLLLVRIENNEHTPNTNNVLRTLEAEILKRVKTYSLSPKTRRSHKKGVKKYLTFTLAIEQQYKKVLKGFSKLIYSDC